MAAMLRGWSTLSWMRHIGSAWRAVVLTGGVFVLGGSALAQDSARTTVQIRNRTLLAPARVVDGLRIEPALDVAVRLVRGITLLADAQTVDNSGPGRQGPYLAKRALGGDAGSGNFLQELTLGVRGVPWLASWMRVEATVSMSRRSYVFIDPVTRAAVSGGNTSRPVPALSVEWHRGGPRFAGGVGLATAGLAAGDGMYFRRLPGDTGSRFGRLSGVQLRWAAAPWKHLGLAGRALMPFEGANTVRRSSGRPVRAPAFDASATLELNPAVRGEVVVSNALGSAGALTLLADREYVSVGGGIRFIPSRAARATPGAFVPGSGSTDGAPVRHLRSRAIAGTAGTSLVMQVPLAPDLGLVVFGDGLRGTVDESEVGASLGLVVHRAGATQVQVVGAASHTNNAFINYLEGSALAHHRLGLRERPIRLGRENEREGEIYLVTGGISLRHEVSARLTAWTTGLATIGQRSGRLLHGFLGGASLQVRRGVHSEVTLGVAGRDNRVGVGGMDRVPVWRAGVAWQAARWMTLDASFGNRIGESPFHALRARSGGGQVWQAGMSLGAS